MSDPSATSAPSPFEIRRQRLFVASCVWCFACMVSVLILSSGYVWIWSAVLVLSGLFLLLMYVKKSRQIKSRRAHREAAAQSKTANVIAVMEEVLPMWSKQIRLARHEGNESVVDLARSFADLSSKIGEELKVATAAVNGLVAQGGAIPVLRESNNDLEIVLKSIRSLESTKDTLLLEVARAGDLADLADEVKQMAMQSKLLSLNAAIEAAHTGVAGTAFSVVVGEMRQLSIRSADTSQRISLKVSQLTSAVADAIKNENKSRGQSAKPIELAEAAIKSVVAKVEDVTADFESLAAKMRVMSDDIKRDVSDSMVALQYQDRISQILDHAQSNIDHMSGLLTGSDFKDITPTQWRREMAENMSMQEEFEIHEGRGRTSVKPQEITYF